MSFNIIMVSLLKLLSVCCHLVSMDIWEWRVFPRQVFPLIKLKMSRLILTTKIWLILKFVIKFN